MADNSYENFVFNKAMKKSGYPKTGVDPIDFWYDKMHYGRVNPNQDAVIVRNRTLDNIGLGSVPTMKELEGGEAVFALNFVADAFNDMKKHFQKATAFNRLNLSGIKEIRSLEPKSAFSSAQDAYDNYISLVFNIFNNVFLPQENRTKRILNFNDFVRMFRNFHDQFGYELVVTKSGFMKSPISNPLFSGLMIELDIADPSDSSNATKWISDPNFNFYRNAAIKYGFVVDKNVPWRLVADVSSREMQDYWVKVKNPTSEQIRRHKGTPNNPLSPNDNNFKTDVEIAQLYTVVTNKYGLIPNPGGASNLFDAYFEQTFTTDALELKKVLFDMYKKLIERSPRIMKFENISCKHKKLSKTFIDRMPITLDELNRKYGMDYWMELCFRMRLKEENLKIEQNEYNKFVQNAKKLMKSFDNAKGMGYTNSVIKMLKSKNLDPRFCQNYEACKPGPPLPIHMRPTQPGSQSQVAVWLTRAILRLDPPSFPYAELAIKSYFENLEEATATAKAIAEASLGALDHEDLGKMYGF